MICWLSALALELLFALLLRCRDAAVYGAAVYNSPTRGSGVLENALLLRCRDAAVYGAALLQMVCAAGWCALLVICWLSARTGNSVLNGKIVSSQRSCTGNSVLNGKIVLESLR